MRLGKQVKKIKEPQEIQETKQRLSAKQAGFTLIELMVVVVIIAVVTSIGVMSLSSNDQARLTNQKNQFKSFMNLVRDQSSFDRALYLVSPDERGLTTYVFKQGAWKTASKVEFFPWQQGLTIDWSFDKSFAQKQQLPKSGWMFWPSGEALAGSVTFSLEGEQTPFQTDEHDDNSVVWNGLLQFEKSP